jgi:DNA helicase-2/ATP-dependent DNA helicase PcrA
MLSPKTSNEPTKSCGQIWGPGRQFRSRACTTKLRKPTWVASRITTQVAIGGRGYNDFAVLYRTNAQSFAFERTFLQHRIPYQLVGGVRFYDRKEIKDIIAYLRLLYQPNDLISFSRIVNVPTRGIGAASFEKFAAWQNNSGMDILSALINVEQASGLTPRARLSFARLGEILRALQVMTLNETSPGDVIEKLIELTGVPRLFARRFSSGRRPRGQPWCAD